MNIPVRTFSRAIEVKFSEDEAVPESLRPWWADTRDNLERIVDRVSDIEQGETSVATTSVSGNLTDRTVEDLFDPGTEFYSQARTDFLSALHD